MVEDSEYRSNTKKNASMSGTIRNVLLIEDNPDDVFLMRRAIKKAGVNWNLQVVTDGQQALEYFGSDGKFADRNQFPLPDLVFVDLKLPYVSGFEVLKSIRSQAQLNEMIVLVLTSSPEERDRQKAMELGAVAYFLKPPTEKVIQNIAKGNMVFSEQNRYF
jgi:CheY-like chemotaxis protein